MNEVFAQAMASSFELHTVGLRYFNIVGPRQDPHGAYASVVPRWLDQLARGVQPAIYGDGETTRDFCSVRDVVQANLLAAWSSERARGKTYNVAMGRRTSLNQLFTLLRDGMAQRGAPCTGVDARYEPFRPGDIRHSQADISAAARDWGFQPRESLASALAQTMDAYVHRQPSVA